MPYHRALSRLAAVWYGHPSEELIVIGVTGTNGKTTTAYLIAKALEASGYKIGCTTTAIFKIGEREWLNDTKMTMLGRFQLQKMLRQMVNAGCHYAVVETSSQGIVQHRHRDLNYDVAVFTNLTPEHIEAHGSFENYKQAKIDLFRHTAACKRKIIDGQIIRKVAVLNSSDSHAKDFRVPGFDEIVDYGKVSDVELGPLKTSFILNRVPFEINLPGRVNIENAQAAIQVARIFDLNMDEVSNKIASIKSMPGRFERIDEGQSWAVIVDYAPEPKSLEILYQTLADMPRARVIHVLGSCGGGRDVARRPVLGRMVAERANIVIVTNEDPYDDNPREIMEQVAEGARQAGKKDGESLFIIEDRREAVFRAMEFAKPGDLVLLTGKGCEQAICVAGGNKIPWDERKVAREAIKATNALNSK